MNDKTKPEGDEGQAQAADVSIQDETVIEEQAVEPPKLIDPKKVDLKKLYRCELTAPHFIQDHLVPTGKSVKVRGDKISLHMKILEEVKG